MIEVELREIRINETNHDQMIILCEKDGERFLPIIIGLCEANAIHVRVVGYDPPRPLTHDLLLNAITMLGGEVEQVVINDLNLGTFYAQIFVSVGDVMHVIDARPSDAIALAVRAECMIFIEDRVLEANQDQGGLT